MEYFYSSGGNNRPWFANRIKVNKLTTEAYEWCLSYPSQGPFSRFHVEWGTNRGVDYDVVQFELEKVAYLFKIAYSELLVYE